MPKTSFRLLVGFAAEHTAKTPSALDIAELDAPLIAAFSGHLEADRHNSVATRNNRLAAVHSLFAYLALHHPENAASIARVLAIPPKRSERNVVTYLSDPEVDALLGACDQATWTGRRDHAMFALTAQAGLRISELAGLRCQDVTLGICRARNYVEGAGMGSCLGGERPSGVNIFRSGYKLSSSRNLRSESGGR